MLGIILVNWRENIMLQAVTVANTYPPFFHRFAAPNIGALEFFQDIE